MLISLVQPVGQMLLPSIGNVLLTCLHNVLGAHQRTTRHHEQFELTLTRASIRGLHAVLVLCHALCRNVGTTIIQVQANSKDTSLASVRFRHIVSQSANDVTPPPPFPPSPHSIMGTGIPHVCRICMYTGEPLISPSTVLSPKHAMTTGVICCIALLRVCVCAMQTHANSKGVKLVGDMPIYVGGQSADVWAHQELFELSPTGAPANVSGVPPDAFSETGQLWGSPLYDWKVDPILHLWTDFICSMDMLYWHLIMYSCCW